jgi:hypothetical protein
MVNAVYAIDDFPGDALLWRIEWIGGVGYNTSVPSDPQISICLAQLPRRPTDPFSVVEGASAPVPLSLPLGCWGATEQKTGLRRPVVSLL